MKPTKALSSRLMRASGSISRSCEQQQTTGGYRVVRTIETRHKLPCLTVRKASAFHVEGDDQQEQKTSRIRKPAAAKLLQTSSGYFKTRQPATKHIATVRKKVARSHSGAADVAAGAASSAQKDQHKANKQADVPASQDLPGLQMLRDAALETPTIEQDLAAAAAAAGNDSFLLTLQFQMESARDWQTVEALLLLAQHTLHQQTQQQLHNDGLETLKDASAKQPGTRGQKAKQGAKEGKQNRVYGKEKALSNNTTPESNAGQAGTPPLYLIEQAVMRLCELQPADVSNLSNDEAAAWRSFGKRVSRMMQSACTQERADNSSMSHVSHESPASGSDSGGDISSPPGMSERLVGSNASTPAQLPMSALKRCSQGDATHAVKVLMAMANLEHRFYCRRYFNRVVIAVCRHRATTCQPSDLYDLLYACAQCKHPLTQTQLNLISSAVLLHLPESPGSAAVYALTALKQLGKEKVHAQQHVSAAQYGSSGVHAQAAATSHPADAEAASQQLKPVSFVSLLQAGIWNYKSDSWRVGLTPKDVCVLVEMQTELGLEIDAAWLDSCLLAAMQNLVTTNPMHQNLPLHYTATSAGANTLQATETQLVNLHPLQDTLQLLAVLHRLRYRPSAHVVQTILQVLVDVLSAISAKTDKTNRSNEALLGNPKDSQQLRNDSTDTVLLESSQFIKICEQFIDLQIAAGPALCAASLKYLLATSNSGAVQHYCKFLAMLPQLLGLTAKAQASWVAGQLARLEQLTQQTVPHLKAATAQELTDFVCGCALLRYHPSEAFLHWHASRCLQLGSLFPPALLVKVQGAYSSLSFRPERAVAKKLYVAVRTLQHDKHLQAYRAAEAVAIAFQMQLSAVDDRCQPQLPQDGLAVGDNQLSAGFRRGSLTQHREHHTSDARRTPAGQHSRWLRTKQRQLPSRGRHVKES